MRNFILIIIWLFMAANVCGQKIPENYAEYRQRAIDAYREGDHENFIKYTQMSLEIVPKSKVNQYNLACGYALKGDEENALKILEKLTKDGIDFGIADDPDFKSLHDNPEFQQIVKYVNERNTPIQTGEIFFKTEQIDLGPEGIASDPRNGNLYFGSMRHGDIYLLDGNKNQFNFTSVDHGSPLSVVGMEVDTFRNTLWAVGRHFHLQAKPDSAKRGLTGIFGFDLNSGELQKKIIYSERHHGFGFNDLTISSKGDIYITGGALYMIGAGSDKIEKVIPEGAIFGTNGLTLSEDEKYLFVADYPTGVIKVALDDFTYEYISHPDTVSTVGVDGLYYYNNSLVAVQNIYNPWRLVRWYLNSEETSIDSIKIIERSDENIAEGMTGAILGGYIYMIGRGHQPKSIPGFIADHAAQIIGNTIILKAPLE